MAELPADNLTNEGAPQDALPDMGPIMVGGFALQQDSSYWNPVIDRGFFSSMPIGWDNAGVTASQRWQALFDFDNQKLTPDEMLEALKDTDMPVPTTPQTRRELERALARHEQDKWAAQYDTNPVGELIGALPPFMVEPVSVATAPIGAANFARAAGAKTLGQFFRQNALGGTKAAAAVLPAEALVQYNTTGDLDTMDMVAAGASSFLFPLALGIPGRVLRGVKNAGRTATAGTAEASPLVDPVRAGEALRENPTVRAPTRADLSENMPPPTTRATDLFNDYQGGHVGWVRDLAADKPEATAKFKALVGGGDVDRSFDPVLSFLTDVAVASSGTRRRSGEDLVQLAQDVANYQATGDAQARGRLDLANMLDAEGQVKPHFAALASSPEAQARFFRDGPEAAFTQEVRAINQEVQTLKQRVAEATPGEAPALVQQLDAKVAELRSATSRPVVVGDEVSVDQVLQALDVARIQRAPSYDARARGQQANPAMMDEVLGQQIGADPEVQAAMAFAKTHGLDDAEVKKTLDAVAELSERMKACGVAT